MKITDLLLAEHDIINRMLRIIDSLSYNLMEELDYSLEDFYLVIDFMKDYVDKHHHKKEDDILFTCMQNHRLDQSSRNLILRMRMEHNTARLYRANLQEALDDFIAGNKRAKLNIIANAVSYIDLMERHMFKEHSNLYLLAEDILSFEDKGKIKLEFRVLEDRAQAKKLQDKFQTGLKMLEEKYLGE